MNRLDWAAVNAHLKDEASEEGPRNRRERRHLMFGNRRHRLFDGTVGTKPPMYIRVARRRAASKVARASRKANR